MECDMAAKDKDLNDLFLDTLKDIYFAEKQILKALPKMAKAAQAKELRAAFEKHHGETEGQVERLEQIFELLDKPARGKTCDAPGHPGRRAGRSWRSTRATRRSMPACWPRHKPSSTTKSPATAP